MPTRYRSDSSSGNEAEGGRAARLRPSTVGAVGAATIRGREVPSPASERGGGSLNLYMLLAAAAFVIAAVGLNLIDTVFAPVFFALTLVLAGQPLQRFLVKHRWPRWLAATVVMAMLYMLLILLVLAMTFSIVQLTEVIPTYAVRFQTMYVDGLTWLETMGVNTQDVQQVIGRGFNVSTVMGALTSMWSAMSSFSTQLLTILLAMFFLAFDVPAVSQRLNKVAERKPDLVAALHSFSYRTRRYWVVATIFGLIVALFDVVALQILGVPLALTWGIFSFVTNYIPNVGFVLGLIPPALMALLDQGVSTMVWVIVLYSVINFVLQSLVQPKFTGDAVGLSPTVTFLSLLFWAIVVGPLGAILAVPLTLFAQSLLIDSVPQARWLNAFLGPEREDPPIEKEEDLGTMVAEGVRRITPRPLRSSAPRPGTRSAGSKRIFNAEARRRSKQGREALRAEALVSTPPPVSGPRVSQAQKVGARGAAVLGRLRRR